MNAYDREKRSKRNQQTITKAKGNLGEKEQAARRTE